MEKISEAPVVRSTEHVELPQKRKWRFQLSLRTFMLLVLVAGVLIPTCYHRVRTVQERRQLVAKQLSIWGTEAEQRTIRAKLKSPLTWWEALLYRPGPQLGPTHNLKVVRPARNTQNYQVIELDPGEISSRKFLVIHIRMGKGLSGGSCDLFSGDQTIPNTPTAQERVHLSTRLAHVYDQTPGSQSTMIYPVNPGETFKLGVTGNWLGNQGDTNNVKVTAFLEDF